MRYLASVALLITLSADLSGAQSLRKGNTRSGTGDAWISGRSSPLSTVLSRTGLHKSIQPGESTSDTLWFLPPLGRSFPASPVFGWIVQNVSIRIDSMDFSNDNALEISIIHAGLEDTLFKGLSQKGANFIGTVFVDSAIVPITGGIPPFTGEFAPARPLSQFVTLNATGSWILRIFSDSTGMAGTLQDWGITMDIALNFTSVGADPDVLPDGIRLLQNYPNPFNPSTTIQIQLPRNSHVKLSVYDLLGRQVSVLVDDILEAGVHDVQFDGSGLASGVYFYRLQAGTYLDTKMLYLLK